MKKNQPHLEVGGGYNFVKKYDAWALPTTELIEMVKKHNNLINMNYDTYFCILEFCIKSL